MSADATPTPQSGAGPAAKPARKRGRTGPVLEGSMEAKRLACLVLEVLSGYRSPASACGVVGLPAQRYYALETRALQAMVAALEPQPRGRQKQPSVELDKLHVRSERLERELRRAQALLRTSQRALGLPPPKETEVTRKDKTGKERRHKRRPRVRSRRVVDQLKSALGVAPGNGPTPAPADGNGNRSA